MVITRRTPSYRYDVSAFKGQVFSPLVIQYHYNIVKNVLEELPDKLDTDKQIQSFKNVALDKVLDKFLPNVSEREGLLDLYTEQLDDLDVLLEADAFAQELRKKYKLPDDMNYLDIISFVKEKSAESLAYLNGVKAKLDKKGGEEHVEKKKAEQEGEQA